MAARTSFRDILFSEWPIKMLILTFSTILHLSGKNVISTPLWTMSYDNFEAIKFLQLLPFPL